MRVALRALVLAALASLTACSTRQVTRPASSYPAACTLLPAPNAGADTITVAVPQHAREDAPADDPLLVHQLYETLITVDCLGTVQPALAEAWHRSAGGRHWTFALRQDARFWDETPVTARHVVESWRAAVDDYAAIDSVTAEGDRTVHVYLRRPHTTAPPLLAGPDFAVTTSIQAHPLGSGPYRTDAPAAASSGRPMLQTVDASRRDLRDLLGGTVDVTITRDPGVLRYAAHQPHLATRPLPWDKTYVLLAPSRSRTKGTAGSMVARLADGLARDAVRADARAAQPPFWWNALQNCDMPSSNGTAEPMPYDGIGEAPAAPRILYDADDPVARGLAERLVALASMDTAAVPDAAALAAAVPSLIDAPAAITAASVSAHELDQRLAEGTDMAYVLALPRHPYDPCSAADALLRRIPRRAPTSSDLPEVLIPLVDTRPHVIARTDRIGLAIDGYGNLRFVPQ